MRVRRSLQRQQTDLRAVAVGDHELVLVGDRREGRTRSCDVRPLIHRRHWLPALQQRVSTQSDHDARRQLPSVATSTALIVCSRFSASSKTTEAGDSNTSSVTSSASRPYFSKSSLPTLVSGVV